MGNVILYTSTNGQIVIPNKIDGFDSLIVSNTYSLGVGRLLFNKDITSIKEYAFCNCKTLKTITLPDSISDIGETAFRGCEALEKFSFPPKITIAEYSVFEMCRNLSVIDLNNVKEIKANAFYGCALKSLTIPSSVSFIGLYAFAYNDRLTHTRIPKSVKDIEPMAFHNCTGELHIDCDIPRSRAYKNDRMADSFGGPFYESKFHSIYLSDHVTTLGAGAFEQNYLLEKISFSQHLTKIGFGAFAECRKLRELNIPSSVIEIEGGVFDSCQQIHITIPRSVRKIGKWAFVNTTGILEINTEVIPEECGYHSRFSTVVFGDNVRVIKYKAFCENSALKEIHLGCNVENIESFAFMKTSIHQLILPNSLRIIKGCAFSECLNLRFVSCQGIVPPDITVETFSKGPMGIDDDMPDLLNIEVLIPKGCLFEYDNSPWCLFKLQEQ
ncbi:leucine-rich repeat domain-containing protein [uncultured Parabacteroides sp.]|uniref:leucine-rich repeat domain-containing protein n=1 Tax=uncultured Parabacteroides sp. TaxID=512312 RepID=UPI0026F0ABBC|nr:leucine-rich repeat domain-containing protein [uncultured Parabacteroides sp.]